MFPEHKAPKIAKLPYKWLCDRYNELVTGSYFMVHKPTYISGWPHPAVSWSPNTLNSHICDGGCQAKRWDDASAAELRAEAMKRGLPESCDRQEVLQMCLGASRGWARWG